MDYELGTIAYLIKRTAIEIFIKLLKKIDGNMDLVLSPQLISTFDLIFGFALLKSNGVQKIYKLDSGQYYNSKKICYVIRPTLCETKMVANSINADKQRGANDTQYWVVFVPQKLQICDECLEKEGVYDYISVLEYPLSLVPLDIDLFSLEFADFYRNCFLSGEQTGINYIIKCLSQLQKLIGSVPVTYSKGKYANLITELLVKRNIMNASNATNDDCIISNVVLIDRDEDYVSVFLSQLNYVGILDETFSINCGKVEFGAEVTKNSDNNKIKHNLFNNDLIFRDIQNTAFSSVFPFLKEKGQKIREIYNERHNMNITAMKEFVANELKDLQSQHRSLCLHISACEVIMQRKKDVNFSEQLRIEQNMIEGVDSKFCLSFIEEGIIRQFPPLLSLRLLSLYSITNSGIPNKDYKNLLKLFVQSYGHQHILTFFNLKKLGIIVENNGLSFTNVNNSLSSANKMAFSRSSESIRKFRQTVKRLNLVPHISEDSYDVKSPKDCAYVFGGAYIPLICRTLELFCDNKNSNEDILKLLQGRFQTFNKQISAINSAKRVTKAVLVFFIGGVTYAEISGLRFLAKQRGIQIFIATTSVINGNTFLSQLML